MISKMYLIAISALLVLFVACDKEGKGAAMDISNNVWITVLNQDGEDLLDPSHPSTIDLS